MKIKLYISMLFILFVISSCNKYEDGPSLSLRSKMSRLLGKWEVIEFLKGSEDITGLYKDTCGCTMELAYDYINSQSFKEYFLFVHCQINDWNYYNDTISDFFDFTRSRWYISTDKKFLLLRFGLNNSSFYRWGMYPLTICKDCLSEFEILRLTNSELWLRYDDLQNVYTIKFEKI